MNYARPAAPLLLALATYVLATGPVAASPKGYDIERLLRQEMPAWRTGRPAQPSPQARPLDRIPNVPAPAIGPEAPPQAPPQAAPQPAPAPAVAPVAAPAPPPQPAPQPAAEPRTADGLRIIEKSGRPQSTVSGAWGPVN